MNVRFHRRVQTDLNQVLKQYYEVSESLGDDFFKGFQTGVRKALENPKFFHFDASGLRRCNLDRFPYHFLYDLRGGFIRIWVVRHNHRHPAFGLRRFDR